MIRYIKRITYPVQIFWTKPFSEKRILIMVVLLLAFFRLLILFFPFKTIARYLGEKDKETNIESTFSSTDQYIKMISRMIKNTSLVVPWESKCLVQAAAAKVLLNRKRIDSTVYFGVNKNNEGLMQAHAWLRVGPDIILGGEKASKFVVVSMFS